MEVTLRIAFEQVQRGEDVYSAFISYRVASEKVSLFPSAYLFVIKRKEIRQCIIAVLVHR